MFYVYILQSEKDKSLYIGYSSDLRKRLVKHYKKQVTSTKDKAPWKLIYYEAYLERQVELVENVFLKAAQDGDLLKNSLNTTLIRNNISASNAFVCLMLKDL